MKIVTIDRRHARSGQGYKVFVQLRKGMSYRRYVEFFEEMYGPSSEWVQKAGSGGPSWGFYKSNTNWYMDLKRRRVYVLNPQDLTLFLIKHPQI